MVFLQLLELKLCKATSKIPFHKFKWNFIILSQVTKERTRTKWKQLNISETST